MEINQNLSGKMSHQHLLQGATVKDVVGQLTTGALRGQQVQVQTINIEQVLCPNCLTRYSAHSVRLTLFDSVTYYGCRVCHQSHDFIEADQVFAILDHQMTQEMVTQGKQVQVNWFA